MSIEEKAKAYDKALEIARRYRDNARAIEEYATATRYEIIFPELRKKEKPLTPFQQCLNCILRGVYYAEVPDEKVNEFILNVVRTRTDELIKLAKRHEDTDCQLHKSKDEEIRQQLLWLCDEWEHNPERRTIPADIDNIKQIRRYLEKQKESLHIQETCKENTDSFTSEDERIRKEIIDFLETIPASELKRIPRPINEWFAWLEKQKEFFEHGYGLYYYHNGGFTFVARPAEEENPYDFAMSQQEKQEYHIPWYDYQKSKEAGYTIVSNEEYEQLIKQREHKPVQYNVEKEYIRTIKSLISDFIRGKREVDTGYYQEIYDWLDGRHVEPNSAWSEEDEKVYSRLLKHYERLTHCVTTANRHQEIREELNFLKSICPSWKPSEEQMDALKELIDDANRAGWVTPGATELYEELKKL